MPSNETVLEELLRKLALAEHAMTGLFKRHPDLGKPEKRLDPAVEAEFKHWVTFKFETYDAISRYAREHCAPGAQEQIND